MPVPKSKVKANNKWVEAHYKRCNLALTYEEMEEVERYCRSRNISKNAFFREAMREKLEREK